MKNLSIYLILCLFSVAAFACNPKTDDAEKTASVETDVKIEVYYFHYTHRCQTCIAVEEETLRILKELYPNQMVSGQITFKALNLEEPDGESLANQLKVSGQTLLFVAGATQVNLTNDGFMYANSNPDKLKEKIKETVDGLLK